jgi:hypothetical protein
MNKRRIKWRKTREKGEMKKLNVKKSRWGRGGKIKEN